MKIRIISAVLALSAAGCTTSEPLRYEGVSRGAGDAIAANTVMQMVDPWPAGVEQTHLNVPADLAQYRKAKPAEQSGDSESIASD